MGDYRVSITVYRFNAPVCGFERIWNKPEMNRPHNLNPIKSYWPYWFDLGDCQQLVETPLRPSLLCSCTWRRHKALCCVNTHGKNKYLKRHNTVWSRQSRRKNRCLQQLDCCELKKHTNCVSNDVQPSNRGLGENDCGEGNENPVFENTSYPDCYRTCPTDY